MRLVELKPRWIHENVFIFLCPHCQQRWLSCKNAPMKTGDQMELFIEAMKDEEIDTVVPSKPDMAWAISGREFETMTVSPSIDASPSGDWHGHIKDGGIV
jgi:hypothetical protein